MISRLSDTILDIAQRVRKTEIMPLRDVSPWNKKKTNARIGLCAFQVLRKTLVWLHRFRYHVDQWKWNSNDVSYFLLWSYKRWRNSPNRRSNGRIVIQRIFGPFSCSHFLTPVNRLNNQASSTSILTKKKYILCV